MNSKTPLTHSHHILSIETSNIQINVQVLREKGKEYIEIRTWEQLYTLFALFFQEDRKTCTPEGKDPWGPISSFYQCGNWGSEKVRNLGSFSKPQQNPYFMNPVSRFLALYLLDQDHLEEHPHAAIYWEPWWTSLHPLDPRPSPILEN